MPLTSNINRLQPNGFKISIDRRNYPNIEYFAQSINHPSVNVAPVSVPSRRVTALPIAGDKMNFSDLTITGILDEDLKSYQEMYNWLERIVNTGHVPATKQTETLIPTETDITVSVLTSHNNKNIQFKYKDVIITDLGPIQFTSNLSTNEFLTFDVSFKISHFQIII